MSFAWSLDQIVGRPGLVGHDFEQKTSPREKKIGWFDPGQCGSVETTSLQATAAPPLFFPNPLFALPPFLARF